MKQPTLKEVKKHFKKALIVESPVGSFDGKIKLKTIRWYDEKRARYIVCDCDNSIGIITLWGYDTGYSKILTYKEKTFTITESQIKTIEADGINYVKEWFPEAFESELEQLPKDFTGWCRANSNSNEKWLMFFEKGVQKYGFDSHGIWDDGKYFDAGIREDNYEATEQEVFEALKNEAVKRGFKEHTFIKDLFEPNCGSLKQGYDKNECSDEEFIITEFGLFIGNLCIFNKGKWAEIISTITLSEAEQQLGKKIIV